MAGFVSPRLEALFSRIRAGTGTISQMNDREVLQCGLNAMDTTDPKKNFDPGFKTQLLAARAEWLRRYPSGHSPLHMMDPVGSTVIARLDDGREVIAKITATRDQRGRRIISFGTPMRTEPAQIINSGMIQPNLSDFVPGPSARNFTGTTSPHSLTIRHPSPEGQGVREVRS
jgi:hypothetical protein